MSDRPTSVIVAGARTPMGRLLGSLKGFSGADLGGVAIKGALEKAGVRPDQVDYVIMGQVLQAGAGQIPARQAAVKAGIPMSVPALTINKVCLSGINAIAMADQMIRAGEYDIVVAGGQESMTNAPHLLEKSREGYKYGDVTVRDHMAFDGLWDAFTDQAMGSLTEDANTGDVAFTREQQDEFSARSHQLAAKAWKDGLFDDEVVPVSIPQRKGDPLEFKTDEGIRADTTADSLGKLRPAFAKDGTITAGSASQISDGAAAVVVMSKAKAEELGLTWLAEIGAHGIVAGGQESMTNAPHLLEKSREGYKYGDVTVRDHMAYDGLWDAFTDQAMGLLTEDANTGELAFTREQQDEFSARSHQLAAKAWKDGLFDDEVVPVSIPQRKGDPIEFKADEGIRADTTTDSLGKLRPAFAKDGTITAGSASQISDGAAAVVVMSKAKAEELGLTWLAEIGAHGIVAGPDSCLQQQPARAIEKACAKEGISPSDLDLVEINEAFAAVGLASAKELGLDLDKVNVNGGAIAMGHPIGMSGARIALHLALELKRRGGGVGAAALCGGGGQGDALIVRVPGSNG